MWVEYVLTVPMVKSPSLATRRWSARVLAPLLPLPWHSHQERLLLLVAPLRFWSVPQLPQPFLLLRLFGFAVVRKLMLWPLRYLLMQV